MGSVKLRLNSRQGLWIEVDCDTPVEAFAKIAEFSDIFGESKCGKCSSTETKYEIRNTKDGKPMYSQRCLACGAQLDFPARRADGGLFVSRKLPDGSYDKEFGGWYRWQERKQQQQYSAPVAAQVQATVHAEDPF